LLRDGQADHDQRLGWATICWDNGETSTGLPGGKYENSSHGSNFWQMTSAGLEIRSETLGGIFQAEIRIM
jgi:hypothetical protein